jgi:uncharacterized protein YggU (UPF0235/DUF167 family)
MEPRATRLEVRVTPGARRSVISGRYGDAWKVSVTAPPDRGRANTALVTLLADELGVPHRSVRVLTGHGARTKIVEVDGLDAQDVDRLLATAEKGARR